MLGDSVLSHGDYAQPFIWAWGFAVAGQVAALPLRGAPRFWLWNQRVARPATAGVVPMLKSRSARAAGCALGLAGAVACVPPLGGWQYADLPAGSGERAIVRESRLSDSLPHLVPGDSGLVLFLCRWSVQQPIPVSLPPDADARERRILRAALAAWSGAGIGVEFREVPPAEARLELRFASGGAGSPRGTGDALSDCAVEYREGRATVRDGRVRAEIRWASIHLIREEQGVLGRPVALQDDQLLGAALHELGHALGYSAHPGLGPSIMQRTTGGVQQIGARVAAGAPFSDPNLAALYALPSGVVVGRLRLDPAQVRLLSDFGRAARRLGLAGPYSRVGDVGARFFYRGPAGVPFALGLDDWRRGLARPREIVFEANAPAARLLEEAAEIPDGVP